MTSYLIDDAEDSTALLTENESRLRSYCSKVTVISTYAMLITLLLIISVSILIYVGTRHPKVFIRSREYPELNGFCDHIAPITESEFALRRRQLRDSMAVHGIDAFIMEPGHSMKYFTNTDLRITERPVLFIITPDRCSFVVPALIETMAREAIPEKWEGDIPSIKLWKENESPYALVNGIIRDEPLKIVTLALDMDMRLFISDNIADLSDIQIVSGRGVASKIRAVKSRAEVEILKCASEATKAALESLYRANLVEAGITEQDVVQELSNALKATGLKNVRAAAWHGDRAVYPVQDVSTAGSNYITNSELVLLEAGAVLHGYQSKISRTIQTRKGFASKNETLNYAWNLVKKSQETVLASLKPGVKCGDLDQLARKVIGEGGYGSGYTYFTHRLGNSIGIELSEKPFLSQDHSDCVLKSGMVLTIGPGIYVRNNFGIRLEDTVEVTETGYRLFGSLSQSLEEPFALRPHDKTI